MVSILQLLWLRPIKQALYFGEKMSTYHLKQYEKEHMKMAMLKQEETFRQQVTKKQLGATPAS
jgi:hypothetical protein